MPDILGVVVADGLYEIQIAPAALLRERELSPHRRAAEHLQRDALFDVGRVAIHGAERTTVSRRNLRHCALKAAFRQQFQ